MSLDKTRLRHWLESGVLPPEHLETAFGIAGIEPAPAQWRRFLERFLLFNAGTLLLAGVAFFFAANWDALGRFARFGLIELALALSLAAAWLRFDRPAGKMALTAAGGLTGVLLGYFGQTYQTGADTWQLFATWAGLILPLALLGRAAPLWLLLAVLVNVAVPLYYGSGGVLSGWFARGDEPVWLLFLLNNAGLALWEWKTRQVDWLPGRSGPRLLALAGGAAVSLQTLEKVLNPDMGLLPVLTVYLAWAGAILAIYRYRLHDLFMLAGMVFSVMAVSTSALGKYLFHGDGLFAFLTMSLWMMVCSAAAVRWLKAVYREFPHE